MLSSVSYVYADKFKILEHVLKICALSTHACVECTPLVNGYVSDALLTLHCKTFNRRCCKNIAVMLNDVSSTRENKQKLKINLSTKNKL